MRSDADKAKGRAAMGGPGGVWESLLDNASLQVAQYLASAQCTTFQPRSAVAGAMFRLLDRTTLGDIISERNYNGLCGRLGCMATPKVCEQQQLLSALDNIDMSCSGEAVDDANGQTVPADGTPAATSAPEEEEDGQTAEDELVYEDDIYTAESFRIAQRNVDELRRLQRRRTAQERRGERKAGRADCNPAPKSGTASAVIQFEDRFCSEWCLDCHETEIRPRVPTFMEYAHPELMSSVATLFPNLRLEVLQRLAQADTQVPLLSEVTERVPSPPTHPNSSPGEGADAVPIASSETQLTLQRYLTAMSEMQGVWRSVFTESVPGVGEPPGVSTWNHLALKKDQTEAKYLSPAIGTEAVVVTPASGGKEVRRTVYQYPHTLPRTSPSLRGTYLVHDFLMNLCGERCHQMMLAHYAAHQQPLQELLVRYPVREGSLFDTISRPVLQALAVRAADATLLTHPATEPLRVECHLEQQRRSILARHLFAAETTSTLSRFLLLDEAVLSAGVWNGVWLAPSPLLGRRGGGPSVFSSLVFPFSVPSLLLTPLHSTPEALQLGVLFVVAAAVVHPRVLEEFLAEDAQLEDVALSIDAEPSDLEAALRLMFF